MSGPVPCRSCGQPVALGRLACPSCGALVASVSRAEPDDTAQELAAGAVEAEAEPEAESAPSEPAKSPESPEPAEPKPQPAAVDAEPEGLAEPVAHPAPAPILPSAAWPELAPRPVAGAPAAPDVVDEAVATDGVASGGIVPGSYLPPSTVHRPGPGSSAGGSQGLPPAASPGPATWAPPSPAASSGGWIPPTPGAAGAPAAGVGPLSTAAGAAASPATTRPRDGRPTTPGRASILADLPFDAPDELEGWLVALGGGLGVLGFFLPWTGAIGEGLEGYLGSWGLGVASRLPVFLLVLVVAALAVLPNRVATWVRTGVCGMVAGGILLGLVWLYLGSDASQLGALLAAVGAILLIAGGIIAVAPGRSARRDEDA